MINIVLIGAGELGSRHLQSLVTIGSTAKITVVEPSSDSVTVAKQRAAEISAVNTNVAEVAYVDVIEKLPAVIDFAIIATGAAPRLMLLTKLLEHAKVEYLVLEKVLFQGAADYAQSQQLIRQYNVKTWVNCPRRMFSAYSDIKEILNSESPVTMTVSGGRWGLACNAIHFIDVFAFLTEANVVSVSTDKLDKTIYPSRRDGYIEVFGSLTIEFDNRHQLIIECFDNDESLGIKLNDANNTFFINEATGEVLNNGKLADFEMAVRYQSELTVEVVRQVLSSGHAEITPFDESVKMHLPFVEALLIFYNQLQKSDSTILPIT